MKKRIVSFVLTAAIGIFSSMSVLGVRAEEKDTESETVGRGTLLYETDTVTRKDFAEGFQNYAQSDATVDLGEDRNAYSVGEPANVVGAVKDYETEEMISGATISIDGEILVTTGSDGRFQIRNFPSGVYDWRIDASGYYTAEYSNYDVDYLDGTTIFTFYISDDLAVQKDREEILNGNLCEQQELTVEETDGEDGIALAAARAMTAPPEINSQIRVLYNGAVHTVDREQYIYTVLSSEVYGANWYENQGLTAAQRDAFYIAQAIVANTYAEYHISVWPRHASDNCDVCSESKHCQKYDPSKVTQAAINAASSIFSFNGNDVCDMIMYKPSPTVYEYALTEFFSGCGDEEKTDNVADRPYSNSVACTDLVYKNAGHHRGMCQMGAAKRAKNGESANKIISYYFSNVEVVPCPLK